MYLEGSDQHRGWFHSSLLESCGTRGRAPFDVVLTHGFVLDENGRKMSKSLGNVIAPQDVIKQSGADILRMWCCASDYADDLRIGPEILKTTVETYRKLRNTLRWMLGSLAHFRAEDRVEPAKMPELERLMLHRLAELDALVRRAYADFDYKRIFAALNAFMTVGPVGVLLRHPQGRALLRPDLLADAQGLPDRARPPVRGRPCCGSRRCCRSPPRRPGSRAFLATDGSVHLQTFPEIPAAWRDDALAEKWRKVRLVRRVVTGAIEIERARQAHRLLARGRPRSSTCPTRSCSPPSSTSTWPRSASPRRRRWSQGEGPADAFRLDDGHGRGGRGAAGAGEEMRPLLEDPAERRLRPGLSRRLPARRQGVARMGSDAQGGGVKWHQ